MVKKSLQLIFITNWWVKTMTKVHSKILRLIFRFFITCKISIHIYSSLFIKKSAIFFGLLLVWSILFFILCPVHLPRRNIFCSGQNVFCPGQNVFCPRQNNFCPRQNIFVPDKKFCSKQKSIFLLVKWMENNFLVMEKKFSTA